VSSKKTLMTWRMWRKLESGDLDWHMLDPFETVEVHMLRQIQAGRNKDMQLALKLMHRPLGVRVAVHLYHLDRDAQGGEDLVS
jgi:hypothetical protein